MVAQRLIWIAGPFNMIIGYLDHYSVIRICRDQGGVFKMEIETSQARKLLVRNTKGIKETFICQREYFKTVTVHTG